MKGAPILFFALVGCSGYVGPDRPADPLPSGGCASDADCTLYCQTKGDCCKKTVCENPALVSAANDIEHYNEAHCTKSDEDACPSASANADAPPHLPAVVHCRRGGCVAEPAPAPPVAPAPTVVDLSPYEKTCKEAKDCRIVDATPCDKCGCPAASIATKDFARYVAIATAIQCPGDARSCAACGHSVAVCESGSCGAKPER